MPLDQYSQNAPLPENQGDVWQRKSGGGCASFFGLPFLLVGIGVIVLTFIPPEVRNGDPIPLFFGIPFGMIFAAVGGAIFLGRSNLRIDRSTGLVEKQWSLLSKPVYSKRSELKDFDRISLRSEIRRSDKSTYTVYPVRLMGLDTEKFDISESRKEFDGRKDAEDLARFLSLPIHDETSGSIRIRAADTLDQSIKQKFESGELTNEIPEPPAVMKSRIEYDGAILHLEIPPPGFVPGLLVGILVIAVIEAIFIGIFATFFFSGQNGDGPPIFFVGLFALLFLGIPTLAAVLLLGNAFMAKQTVVASSASLQVTRGWPLKKTVNIPSDEIEELFITAKPQGASNRAANAFGAKLEITAVSDAKQTSFGAGLASEELEYLLALAKGILIS